MSIEKATRPLLRGFPPTDPATPRQRHRLKDYLALQGIPGVETLWVEVLDKHTLMFGRTGSPRRVVANASAPSRYSGGMRKYIEAIILPDLPYEQSVPGTATTREARA